MKKFIVFLILVVGIWWIWPTIFPKQEVKFEPENSNGELAGAEQSYYEQVFDYVMSSIGNNQTYAWESYSVKGNFTVGKPFVSKSKSTCRKFSEEFTGAKGTTNIEGIACKREGRDGWCKLKMTDAQTCAMEKKTAVDSVMGGANDAMESSKEVIGKVKGWWR